MCKSNAFVKELIDGYEQFREVIFPLHEKEFLDSVERGQKPGALIITCSDSRIVLASLFTSDPGRLFVIRNVGNIIPSYSAINADNNTSVIAGVEYALNVLGIRDIIVMGHSQCGAVQAIYDNVDLSAMHGLKAWLKSDSTVYQRAHELIADKRISSAEGLAILEKFNIVAQIGHLKTYPSVKKALKNKGLFIHGWFYQIDSGTILYYDPDSRDYKNLSDITNSLTVAIYS